MSNPHARGAPKGGSARGRSGARTPDGAIYIGLLMIGGFAIWLWSIVSPQAGTWKQGLLGYIIAIAFLVNLYTWRACRGRRLAGWQQSLARLPLRWAGYGTKEGRPLEAAKGSPRAKIMLLLSIATSIVIIVLLTWLMIPL